MSRFFTLGSILIHGVVLTIVFVAQIIAVGPLPTPREAVIFQDPRLVTLVGADAVGAVALADSHRPDAFVPARLELATMPQTRAGMGDAVLALRRLRPPRRVGMLTDGDGRPVVVRGALGAEARVIGCAGPWRLSSEWWDADAWARDEWDVALSDGAVCRLARDLRSGDWYLDAVYD